MTLADLLRPIVQDAFHADYRDKRPLHIARGDSAVYDWLLTRRAVYAAIAT
jgi:hypothetical protein